MISGIKKPFRHARNFLILMFSLMLLGGVMMVGSLDLLLRSAFLTGASRKQFARLAITRIFRWYFYILQTCGVLRLDLSGIEFLREERGVILVANHPSLLDALLIASRLPNVVCIMKEQVLRNVLFGYGAKTAGYIPNISVHEIVTAAAAELRAGSQLLLFPEGTRTCNSTINALQATAGLIAKRTGAEVQTILIESESGFLGKGWPVYRAPMFPVHFRLHIGKRFASPMDVRRFTLELQDYFEQELGNKSYGKSQMPIPCTPMEMHN